MCGIFISNNTSSTESVGQFNQVTQIYIPIPDDHWQCNLLLPPPHTHTHRQTCFTQNCLATIISTHTVQYLWCYFGLPLQFLAIFSHVSYWFLIQSLLLYPCPKSKSATQLTIIPMHCKVSSNGYVEVHAYYLGAIKNCACTIFNCTHKLPLVQHQSVQFLKLLTWNWSVFRSRSPLQLANDLVKPRQSMNTVHPTYICSKGTTLFGQGLFHSRMAMGRCYPQKGWSTLLPSFALHDFGLDLII